MDCDHLFFSMITESAVQPKLLYLKPQFPNVVPTGTMMPSILPLVPAELFKKLGGAVVRQGLLLAALF